MSALTLILAAQFISVPGGRNAAFETACFVKTVTNAAALRDEARTFRGRGEAQGLP